MSIQRIGKPFAAYEKIQGITNTEPNQGVKPTKQGSGFGDMLSNAIKEVDGLQKTADNQMEQMILGTNSNPHEAMIALEKADVAFQLMNSVRAKIVRAYEEVMRAQV
jgi:flagellar hook-basal body complex protein FliE